MALAQTCSQAACWSPWASSGVPLYVGRGEFLDLLETLGFFSYSHPTPLGTTTCTERSANLIGLGVTLQRSEAGAVPCTLSASVTDMCSVCMLMCVASFLLWLHTKDT